MVPRGEVITRLLAARGLEGADLELFLNPTLDRLASPVDLPGVAEAAEVVLGAVSAHRRIVVFGDYDCDGVCATAILLKALRALCPGDDRVTAFIPDRLAEGYGMSDASLARLLRENPGVGLVVTVDNGINSIGQVAALRTKGVAVVITDHHLPSRKETGELVLPAADAVVDPKVVAPSHLEGLCGAGVAFLLANRVICEARRRNLYDGPPVGGPLLVLAGLATVTDIMPLLGQNRILVSEALRRFAVSAPLGLKELHARAARSVRGEISSRDFGFLLGPRINAAGRLASALEALELVMCEDREIVRESARIIDGYNLRRKEVEQAMLDEAMAKVVPGASAQVIDLPGGHPGVAGIVAARVMERLGGGTPVCVYAGGHGSARAPEGLNIRDAFEACADTLERFGGHAAAGGFTVREGLIDEFRAKLCAYCARFATAVAEEKGLSPDLWVGLDDLTLELADDLRQLEPYGEGNREPEFGVRGVFLSEVRPLGGDGRHLVLSIAASASTGRASPCRIRAVWWGRGNLVEGLRAQGAVPHDITCTLAVSDYGERHVELHLTGIAGLD